MSIKDQIRAEIERRRKAQLDINGNAKDLFCAVRLWAYADLLGILDTLPEQADGLEEAAEGSDFREKLAAYMKSAFEKGRYVLSSETILKMAEEELLKRGVVQKPAEMKEDEE